MIHRLLNTHTHTHTHTQLFVYIPLSFLLASRSLAAHSRYALSVPCVYKEINQHPTTLPSLSESASQVVKQSARTQIQSQKQVMVPYEPTLWL